MWLNVIWCKVSLDAMLASSFLSNTGMARCLQRGHLMACICSCLPAVPCLGCHFCAVFFPSSPSHFSFGPVKYLVGKYSTEQFSVRVPCGRRSQGCHGYLLPCARALLGSTNFVGTSAQAHLLVMSLIFLPCFLRVTFCLVYSCWWFCWSPAQRLKDDKSSLQLLLRSDRRERAAT